MKRKELTAYDKWLTRRKWRTGEIISPEKAADLYLAEHPLPPAEGAEEILPQQFISTEDVKRWFQLLVGKSESVMHEDINKTLALHAQKIADKMVSKRWINVKDRLPRKDGKSSIYCLVNSEYDGIVMRPYNEYHKCWDTEDADDYYCDAVGGKITHWMPLPNPPIK